MNQHIIQCRYFFFVGVGTSRRADWPSFSKDRKWL